MSKESPTVSELFGLFDDLARAVAANDAEAYRTARAAAQEAGVEGDGLLACWEVGVELADRVPSFDHEGQPLTLAECSECGAGEGEACAVLCTASPRVGAH